MTVALYCRVSTDEQAEHGFSLDAQKDRLIAYCQSQGWKDYEVYTDDGYSGTSLDRPALKRLLRDVERGRIDCVVVYRLDRLSRRQRHCLYLLEEVFEARGVAFKSATEPFDTSTPLGKAMIGILAVFAQLERDTIIERTKEGHHKRARQGLWGGGPQPFGYAWNKESGQLEVVPEEAQIVRGIYRRFLDGHSLSSLADWARARSKESRWWDHTVVKSILQREIYTGHVQYGPEKAQGNHEAIVDPETAATARNELKQREGGKRGIGQYLLSGLLRCEECGEPVLHHLVSRPGGKKHHYYVCARKTKGKKYYKSGDPCGSRHIAMETLDAAVIAFVHQIATDPSVLTSDNDENHTELQSAITNLRIELSEVGRKLQRWYDAYEEEEIDAKQLGKRTRDLEAERTRIELLIDEMEIQMIRPDPAPVIDAFNAIRDAWSDMDFGQKQRVLRAAIRTIRVDKDGGFNINWNFG